MAIVTLPHVNSYAIPSLTITVTNETGIPKAFYSSYSNFSIDDVFGILVAQFTSDITYSYTSGYVISPNSTGVVLQFADSVGTIASYQIISLFITSQPALVFSRPPTKVRIVLEMSGTDDVSNKYTVTANVSGSIKQYIIDPLYVAPEKVSTRANVQPTFKRLYNQANLVTSAAYNRAFIEEIKPAFITNRLTVIGGSERCAEYEKVQLGLSEKKPPENKEEAAITTNQAIENLLTPTIPEKPTTPPEEEE